MKVSPSVVTVLAALSLASAHDQKSYGWQVLEERLPKKLSDHSASVGSDGLMYLAGGCGKLNCKI